MKPIHKPCKIERLIMKIKVGLTMLCVMAAAVCVPAANQEVLLWEGKVLAVDTTNKTVTIGNGPMGSRGGTSYNSIGMGISSGTPEIRGQVVPKVFRMDLGYVECSMRSKNRQWTGKLYLHDLVIGEGVVVEVFPGRQDVARKVKTSRFVNADGTFEHPRIKVSK